MRKKRIKTTDSSEPQSHPVQHRDDVVAFMEKYKRTAGQKKQIVRALTVLPCEGLRVVGISKATHAGVGVILNLDDANICSEINSLLAKRNLGPMTEFQTAHSVAYGAYGEKGLDTVMITTTGMIGSSLKVCTQIDWIASVATSNHMASDMVERLKSIIVRRRQKSYVITQCDMRASARNFWKGRLTQSSWADVFVGLMHIYDERIQIYEGAWNMIS